MWKFFRGLVLLSMPLLIVLAVTLSIVKPELQNELILSYSDVFTSVVISIVTIVAIIALIFINTRVSSERKSGSGFLNSADMLEEFFLEFSNKEQQGISIKINDGKNDKTQEKEKLKQDISKLQDRSTLALTERPLIKSSNLLETWRDVLLSTRRRLLDEGRDMQFRNKLNMLSGIVSAVLGALWLFISPFPLDEINRIDSGLTFLVSYWPRVGIIIIIGVFTGFFLRLYTQTIRRIDKNRNEITNIELRLTSGLMLYDAKNKDNFAILADTLSKEERNFILRKNETSANSETLDIEKLKEIISLLVSVGTK